MSSRRSDVIDETVEANDLGNYFPGRQENSHPSDEELVEIQENLETKFKVLHACADSQVRRNNKDYQAEKLAMKEEPVVGITPPDEYLTRTENTGIADEEKCISVEKSPLTPAVLKSHVPSRRRGAYQIGAAVYLTDLVKAHQKTRRRNQRRKVMSMMAPVDKSDQNDPMQHREDVGKSHLDCKDFRKRPKDHERLMVFNDAADAGDATSDDKKMQDELIIDRSRQRDSHAKQMEDWLKTFDHIPDIGVYDRIMMTYEAFENRLRENSMMNDGVVTYSINGPEDTTKVHFIIVKEAPGTVVDIKEPSADQPSTSTVPASITSSAVPVSPVTPENMAELAPITAKTNLNIRHKLDDWNT